MQIEVHHSNLRTGTDGVQLIKALQEIRALPLLFRRWYCLLSNVKSIRRLVMFKIRNVSVGHLYDFSDFVWSQSEQSYNRTRLIMRFFYYDNPQYVVKFEGYVSWPSLE